MGFKILLLIGLSCITQISSYQFHFACQELSADIIQRMSYTWRDDSPVPCKDLCYIQLSHFDFNGEVQQGELIVHRLAVDDIEFIFEQLFIATFPLTSMKFIDEFEGSDDASMKANNTSAFYARKVAGKSYWSNHSYGLAIDINPLINPYCKGDFCCPEQGKVNLKNRSYSKAGMITSDSDIYDLFLSRGWEWGGECFYDYDGVIDLHHFQKAIPGINKSTNRLFFSSR
ncbi:M15 family metallopeptidase [bacterium]|jgi:hypothetical protein|nr:M15 family metallopeptidase [bacterium]MBT5015428.1 M15 family metallopeptidase [bacterium]